MNFINIYLVLTTAIRWILLTPFTEEETKAERMKSTFPWLFS